MHRLGRRTQAGESGVYPFPFIHAFVVLMFINSMHGLRVEGVCACAANWHLFGRTRFVVGVAIGSCALL